MIEILKIKHPSLNNQENEEFGKKLWNWSPLDICEGKYAVLRRLIFEFLFF